MEIGIICGYFYIRNYIPRLEVANTDREKYTYAGTVTCLLYSFYSFEFCINLKLVYHP